MLSIRLWNFIFSVCLKNLFLDKITKPCHLSKCTFQNVNLQDSSLTKAQLEQFFLTLKPVKFNSDAVVVVVVNLMIMAGLTLENRSVCWCWEVQFDGEEKFRMIFVIKGALIGAYICRTNNANVRLVAEECPLISIICKCLFGATHHSLTYTFTSEFESRPC